jgi:hypothetical protein
MRPIGFKCRANGVPGIALAFVGDMALVQALLAALFRSAGKLLNTAFGWATSMLFGRVPEDRQIYLSIIAFGSVAWIIAVFGIAFPAFATWLLSFVKLPDWIDKKWVRIAMLAAAVLIPGIVGALSLRMVDPAERPKTLGGKVRTILKGYPYTVGLAATLLLMTALAPVLKVRNLARRWTDEHVPVIIKPEDYRQVLTDVQSALRTGGLETTPQRATWMLRTPTKVLTLFAGGAVSSMVADDLTVLKGEAVEVLLHPSDVVISGREVDAAHARAILAENLTFTKAYLTWHKEANEIEDRLRAIWEDHRNHHGDGRQRVMTLEDVERALHEQKLPYEEWEVLFREKLVVEREVLRALANVESNHRPARPHLLDALIAHADVIAETLESLRDAAREARKALRRAA